MWEQILAHSVSVAIVTRKKTFDFILSFIFTNGVSRIRCANILPRLKCSEEIILTSCVNLKCSSVLEYNTACAISIRKVKAIIYEGGVLF